MNTSNYQHFILTSDIHNSDFNIPRKKNVQEGDFMWKTRTSYVSVKFRKHNFITRIYLLSIQFIFFHLCFLLLFRPFNILDGDKNALPTAACFGCCINYLFYILFLNDNSKEVEPWLASKLLINTELSI